MIKVFYSGLGCLFEQSDLERFNYLCSYSEELRVFMIKNTGELNQEFVLSDENEKRFNNIGNADVDHLCFDDDTERKLFLIEIDDHQIISGHSHRRTSITIYNDSRNVFESNKNNNALRLLIDNGNSKTEPKKESTLKTENLLKVIICMAIDKYGYDPKASRNNATGLNKDGIVSTLAQYGVDISDDTIKSYLKDGAKLIDDKKLPELG